MMHYVVTVIKTCIFVSVELPQLTDPVENKCIQNSGNNASVMANGILAVLLVISVICIIVLTAFVFKLKLQLHKAKYTKR